MKYRITIEVEIEGCDDDPTFPLRNLKWSCEDAHKEGHFNSDHYEITEFASKAERIK